MIVENVIHAADPILTTEIITSRTDPSYLDFFRRNYETFVDRLSEYGSRLAETAKRTFEYFTSREVIDGALDTVRRSGTVLERGIHVVDAYNIYEANIDTRPYIIAYPRLFNLYRKDRCSAWDDEILVREKDRDPLWREDYANVANGIMIEEKDKNVFRYYSGYDLKLTTKEQFIMRRAWDVVAKLMAEGIDPTSHDRESL